MHKNNRFRTRGMAAAALFAIAIALMCIVFVRESRQHAIEGWTPVNGALEEAIDALASPSEAADGVASEAADQPSSHPPGQASEPALSQSPKPPTVQGDGLSPSPASPNPDAGTVEESPIAAAPGTLDLNKATEADLDALPGIGPSKAKAIIAHRDKIGGFRRVEQLLDVKGIGPKVFERLSALVHVAAEK